MNKRPPRNGEKVEEIQNTLLVDGNALFKRALRGAKGLYNKDGVHIGGVYQFLTTLRMLLEQEMYHRVYVFWDGNFSGKLRYEIYEPYKSDRGKDYKNGTQPTDESELKQRRLVWKYLNELCIRQLVDEVIEGDDFIAYYCLTKSKNEKITICTNDRDMAQLIDDDVRIFFLDLKNYVGKSNYSSYFSHNQENSALLKTIAGDTSDSIKGIKGVKEKTLLNLFPELTERKVTLNEIIDHAKKQQEERIANKLKPLISLQNIIDGVTDGVQGNKIYEINEKLVNLKKPMMTKQGIKELELLKNGFLLPEERDGEFKEVYKMMKEHGLDKEIGEYRYPDYLVPFKKLISREEKITSK
jgi:5'-3' exonuclease